MQTILNLVSTSDAPVAAPSSMESEAHPTPSLKLLTETDLLLVGGGADGVPDWGFVGP